MKIFGKPLSDYFGFQKVILILILLVGFGRLGLSLAGVSNDAVKWLSVTAMAIVGTAYVGVQVPRRGFGGYKQLLPLLFIQAMIGNLIIVSGIVLATVTGTENIFSRPEYSGGMSPLMHAGGHLLDGVLIGPLIGWLISSIIMFFTRKISPAKSSTAVPA